MSTARTLDVSGLPDSALGSHAPLWWGQVVMMIIESTVVLMLVFSYFYTRTWFTVWPPPRIPPASVTIPTIGLVVLIASCIPAYLSGRAVEQKRFGAAAAWLAGNVILALIFLALRWKELIDLPFKWVTGIYGSFVWSLITLHTMHAIADVSESLVFLAIAGSGRMGGKQQLGYKVDGLYWYWVVGLGVVLFPLIYWYPNAAIGAGR